MRLDQYMAEYWPEYSRATWQKYIKLGYVRVNGTVSTDANQRLDEDDEITYELKKNDNHSEKTLPVVYEDENVIVIDKPVGVLTHSKGALNDEFTVADFFKPLTAYHTGTNRPGIIHRLDRDTSGILIGAKNPEAAHLLLKQFQNRKAKKTYYAVLDGVPKETKANVDLPIGRNPKKPSTFRVDAGGKSAQTYYEILDSNDRYALVKLQPTTGRTHQLRVHMAYLGTPILGDRVYDKPADRLYLHAEQLEITIPRSKRMTFTAPIPEVFKEKIR